MKIDDSEVQLFCPGRTKEKRVLLQVFLPAFVRLLSTSFHLKKPTTKWVHRSALNLSRGRSYGTGMFVRRIQT